MASWIRTILILPFNVVVVIPSLILYFSKTPVQLNTTPFITLGAVFLILGLSLAAWTMCLFATIGKGTAAPWNPPKNLVVKGPYCHVRNPMITSVLMMLIALYFILNAWQILAWCALFFLINSIYFPLFEEKDLEKRFGKEYIEYKNNVPRWLPRLTKWQQK